jgi:lipoyl-dependent peroxiredoxin
VKGSGHGARTTAANKRYGFDGRFLGEVKSVAGLAPEMAAVKSTAEAVWENDLPHGKGRVKGTSGGLAEVHVSWAARTGTSSGNTTPEELLAAAHASCFSMALSGGLGRMQKVPTELQVTATATFDKVGEAWKVTTMELTVVGKVPGITAPEFDAAAQAAGQGCPISNVMKGNVAVTVKASLA